MARPTCTWRSAVYSTTNASPYTATTAWTPAANSLIVCFVANAATSPVDPTDVSGHGVTYSKVVGGLLMGSGVNVSVWVANAGASPTSAAGVATVGGSPTGCVVDEFEVTNWNTTNGALGAVDLTATANSTTGTGSVSIPLSPETVNESAYLSFFVHLANETSTGQGGNWTATAGGTGNFNTPATGAIAQHNNTGYTATATATWTSNTVAWRGLVIEISGTTEGEPSESLKVADQAPTARLNPYPLGVSDEPLKVSASGQVTLINQGAIKITDTVTASLVSGLSRQVTDEPIKIADTVTVQLTKLLASGFDESLKIADSVSVFGALQELLHLDDGGWVTLYGLGAWVKVQDTVTASLFSGIGPSLLTETLKLADTVSAGLTPLFASVSQESLKVDDTDLTAAIGMDEILHVVDQTPIAQIQSGADLTRTVTAENLKLADTVTVLLNPLQTAQPAESLKVADTITSSEDPLVAAPVVESLKVQDTVTASENPLFTVVAVESLKVQDTVIASTGGLVAPLSDDPLHVQDTVVAQLDTLLISVTSEALKVQDSVSAQLDTLLVSSTAEALKVQDTVTAIESLGASGFDEALKVQDTVSVSLTVLRASGFDELLHIQDSVFTGAGLIALPSQESLKVQDTVAVARDLEAIPSESLKISETQLFGLSLPATPADESVKLADTVSVVLTPLQASTQEALKVRDSLIVFGDLLSVVIAPEGLQIEDIWETVGIPEPGWICYVLADDWTCIIHAENWTVLV